MRRRNLKVFVLLLALVFTQGLAVAHAFEHPLLGKVDHACNICAHGQGFDHGLAGQNVCIDSPLQHQPQVFEEPAPSVLNNPLTAPHIRAPPFPRSV